MKIEDHDTWAAILNDAGQVTTVIWEKKPKYITTSSDASMGFSTLDGAVNWAAFVNKPDRPILNSSLFKWLPEEIKQQILKNTEQ